MPDSPLEPFFNDYIAAINRHSSLASFVHEEVIYNGQRMTLEDYEDMIEASFAYAPDLYFNVKMLLTTNDTIAARIWLDCHFEKEFLGLEPPGKTVQFAEHVFYRIRDGMIEEVWAVFDN